MFKHIRSFVGKLFNENQQMLVVMYLSHFYWFLRKYFLAVEIIYPEEFFTNWSIIKHYSSLDRERNLTVYQMIKVHNEILIKKGNNLNIIKCYFLEKIDDEIFKKISSIKYSFIHVDFDLYKLTLDVITFVIPRHEKNAIILLDDYNLINQEGVKWAVRDSGVNINKCIQTQSGQLICYT